MPVYVRDNTLLALGNTGDLLRFKIFGMPLPLYAFALITLLLSHFYNAIPTDLVGGFAL
ncbi:hypothetical protein MJN85_30815, partial [Salmonella enterica subsp. enterica serovar Anatum]|nr:hypothetical protein [Salmonella enterica subsp. enterica serovar Anatum]